MRSKLTLESGHSVVSSDRGLRVELDLDYREFVFLTRMLSTGNTEVFQEADKHGVDLRKVIRDLRDVTMEVGDTTSAAPEVLQ